MGAQMNVSDLPELFVSRLQQIVPEGQSAAVLQAMTQSPEPSMRVNTLLTSTEEVRDQLSSAGIPTEPTPFTEALTVRGVERRTLTDHVLWSEGRIHLQNLSSLVPTRTLDPQPGERVLDLCAAPGGKTTHLMEVMKGEGQVVAVEKSKPRTQKLKRVVAHLHAPNVTVWGGDGSTYFHREPEAFDRVLLDAPCSGEAEIHAMTDWGMKKIKRLVGIQSRLLFSAARCLKVGGTLVYSTCTTAPEENEGVITRFLERHEGAFQIDPVILPSGVPAQSGLVSFGKKVFHSDLGEARRILANGVFEAFFACRLTKIAALKDAAKP